VTPVAGGVSDGEKDRLVFGARSGERLIVPGKPVDGILRVLEKVRTALLREAIHQGIMTLRRLAAERAEIAENTQSFLSAISAVSAVHVGFLTRSSR
jgi:hypothetical protein